MAVSEVEECAGAGDAEVDGGAFGDFVEVHVAPVAAGVSGAGWGLGNVGCCGDAAQHGFEWNGVVLEVVGGFFGGGCTGGAIEMPADAFADIFHLDGQTAVEGALVHAVVADGPVAVEGELLDVDDEDVAGHGSGDEKGAGLRVAAEGALGAAEVVAAGVNCRGVDGVSGVDREDGFVECGDLTVEDGWGELVALRRGVGERRDEDGCDFGGDGVGFVVGVGLCIGGLEGAVGDGAGNFVGVVLLVLGEEMDGVALEGAFKLVAAVGAGEFVAGLLEGDAVVERGAEVVGGDKPAASEGGSLGDDGACGESEQTEGQLDAGHARFSLDDAAWTSAMVCG